MTDDLKKQNGLNISFDEPRVTGANIKVIGVGGGGCNAVNRMIEAGINGVEFIVANTDLQALNNSKAQIKLQLGAALTRGLGAGSDPDVGREAAIEDTAKIAEVLEGADMVFITTGLGGGTGTGAAPVFGAIAMDLGVLTVAVVTKPFGVEGAKRMRRAEEGLAELRGCADTVLTIPNSRLSEVYGKISIHDAFRRADDVLLQAVKGISDLITSTGTINRDFSDVRTVMKGRGVAIMGTGTAVGPSAAVEAMKQALESRLLEHSSISGATGALINFHCPEGTDLFDIEEAVALVEAEAHDDADIMFGTVFNSENDEVNVTLIATGFDSSHVFASPIISRDSEMVDGQTRPRQGDGSGDGKNIRVPTFIRRQAD
jgi:cell division protein FtsZ